MHNPYPAIGLAPGLLGQACECWWLRAGPRKRPSPEELWPHGADFTHGRVWAVPPASFLLPGHDIRVPGLAFKALVTNSSHIFCP